MQVSFINKILVFIYLVKKDTMPYRISGDTTYAEQIIFLVVYVMQMQRIFCYA